jgi:hypothetical protein
MISSWLIGLVSIETWCLLSLNQEKYEHIINIHVDTLNNHVLASDLNVHYPSTTFFGKHFDISLGFWHFNLILFVTKG